MEIIYWGEKVEKFINDLDLATKSRTLRTIYQLRDYGNLLDMPDSKSLGKGLFELRTQGKIKVRLLYIFHDDKIFIIHGFVKKAWRINVKDIRYARNIQRLLVG